MSENNWRPANNVTGYDQRLYRGHLYTRPVRSGDYAALGMDNLCRLIRRDWDNEALEEWRRRYGHDWPVYAVIDGQPIKWEP